MDSCDAGTGSEDEEMDVDVVEFDFQETADVMRKQFDGNFLLID